MKGVIFFETLRRGWKATLIFALALSLLPLYIVAVLGDSTMFQQYTQMLTAMSWAVDMFGGGDQAFTATPAGILNFGLFSWTILFLAAYAVIVGLSATANEEEQGILDVLLSAPVPRWQVVLEKLLAFTVNIIVVLIIYAAASVAVVMASTTFNDPATGGTTPLRLVEATFNMLPPTLLVMGFTALFAVLVRRRNTAASIAAAFVVASYFVDMIARTAQAGDGLRALSFFAYYDSVTVMRDGLLWGNLLGMTAVAVALGLAAMWRFGHREIGV